MKTIEISAKTVEEAFEAGIKELGVKRDNVKLEIINEPSQGLFKFLSSKNAKIKLTVLKGPEDYIKDFLEKLLHIINIKGNVNFKRENGGILFYNISGKDLGLLIGKRGNTLNALQYLINVILHRQFTSTEDRVIIDIENYREKRRITLEQLAKNLALKAMRTNKEVVLEPMTPSGKAYYSSCVKK